MTYEEIIRVNPVPTQEFEGYFLDALKYALFSFAFTIDRMDKKDITHRISNIIKGKVAEAVFYNFMLKNGAAKIDKETTSTPYWMADQKDFVFRGGEWDIKNNFISCDVDMFYKLSPNELPALVPNRHAYDQWSLREKVVHGSTKYSAYVFTFMRLDKNNRNFFNLDLEQQTLDFLSSISHKYSKWAYSYLPEAEQQIIEGLLTPAFVKESYIVNYQPEMIITACANRRYWQLFSHLEAESKICKGLFKTRISNAYCEVEKLPAFANLLK